MLGFLFGLRMPIESKKAIKPEIKITHSISGINKTDTTYIYNR